jgi:hypothetical protein
MVGAILWFFYRDQFREAWTQSGLPRLPERRGTTCITGNSGIASSANAEEVRWDARHGQSFWRV